MIYLWTVFLHSHTLNHLTPLDAWRQTTSSIRRVVFRVCEYLANNGVPNGNTLYPNSIMPCVLWYIINISLSRWKNIGVIHNKICLSIPKEGRHLPVFVNSCRLSDICVSKLVKIMACRLIGAKPLSESIMTVNWTPRTKFSEIWQFSYKKINLKLSPVEWCPFNSQPQCARSPQR